tara:strand:+ start:2448 stop:3338 length:891 start_codon:yes stop_codon:yes gene_type:complete
MWVMPAQGHEGVDDSLNSALTYANGNHVYELSTAERAAIHTVYKLYDAMLGQPHEGLKPAALDAARPFLYSAYDQIQIGGRLAALRAHLLASVDSCPYCGFGEPRDLDHYLPRSQYGELAIYPNNLIPSCAPCNNAKRTVVPGLGTAHGPGLIHPYYQDLPDLDFLKADIVFENGSLSVSFRIENTGIDPDLATKLQFQLDRLKLNGRYPKQINKFINEQRTAILMFKGLGVEVLSDYLQRNAASLAGSFHRNDWRVALLRGLAEAPDFCQAPETYLGPEADFQEPGVTHSADPTT